MPRKGVSTLCKAKQIPRIFQRRNQLVRGVVRGSFGLLEGANIDGNIASVQDNSSVHLIVESNDGGNKHLISEKIKGHENGSLKTDDYSTRNWNTCEQVSVNPIAVKIDVESPVENSVSTDAVDDIEKWLKTRTESISSIELDTMKCVVEEEEDEEDEEDQEEEEEVESVGVDRYLADDLPHAFLGKDPDGLSIDIDLSDKKLNLGYDPLIQEMQSDKLLEVCEKNDDFILPEFQLDQLDPLALSPDDMMVAGEILPSTSNQPNMQMNMEREMDPSDIQIGGQNVNTVESESGKVSDKPVQSDVYDLVEELEEIDEEIQMDEAHGTCMMETIIQPQIVSPINGNGKSHLAAMSKLEGRTKAKSKSEPRIMKKHKRIWPKSDKNAITFVGDPCRIDGKDGVMAVVAISTDKISNMTQIVINTGMDEQIYQGKTSELIEATGNFPKLSKMEMENSGRNRPHERVVSKALEELGITDESLRPTSMGENGNAWLCPRDECNREFSKLYALKAHLIAHYGVRPYKCDYEGCAWAFHSDFKLKRHKETHLKRKNFACEVSGCNRRFTTVYNLWSHKKLHTRPNRIVCQVPDCQEKFQTKRALELHMRKHDQSHAPYVCNHEGCGKRYYTCNALTSHQRCHNYKEIDVKCSWPGCGKIFDKPCRLKAHMRSHTGSKPYTCTYQDCQWAFSSSSKLKRHQKKHTNERKFICDVEGCGKAFLRSEHLKGHLLTHAGGGYFQCHMCDAHFCAKSSLYVHIKKHQVKEAVDTIIDNGVKGSKRKLRNPQVPNESSLTTIANESSTDSPHPEKFHENSIYATPMNFQDSARTVVPQKPSKAVRKERNSVTYNCDMEQCDFSPKTLSSLGAHMVTMHASTSVNSEKSSIEISPIEDASDLDYIMYETPRTTENCETRNMMLQSCDSVILSETPKNIACLPEPEPPPHFNANPTISSNGCGIAGEKKSYDQRERKTSQGSARTGLTYADVWKLKCKDDATETTVVGASDVVLGTANLNEGLLLTEELPSMYYHDDMVGTECQILLLDSGNHENSIDLRGLE